MKMYVWDDVLADWTSGIAVAVAVAEDEANAVAVLLSVAQKQDGEYTAVRLAGDLRQSRLTVHELPYAAYCHGGA